MSKLVKVSYNADTLETTIVVDGKEFDTSRISGKEIADWVYPFMVRKVRWDGFYDEMVAALGGEKAFDLVFEGSDEALAELKEAWENAPVNVVSGEQNNIVTIAYDADTLTTEISINGQPFDNSRINGKEIEDWVYPFMMRKVKWDGIFDELKNALGTDEYEIQFSGTRAAMKALMEECPETVSITCLQTNQGIKSSNATIPEKIDETSVYADNDSDLQNNSTDSELLFQKGMKHYERRDYLQAVQCFLEAANMGSAKAALSLGDCYRFGKGLEQNDVEAFKWYMISAELGDVYGKFEAGCCFYNGEGIKIDRIAALELYLDSYKSGNNAAKEMIEFLLEVKQQSRRSRIIQQNERNIQYVTTVSSRSSDVVNYYDDDESDYSESYKLGLKIGAGAVQILGTIIGLPELGIAAKAVEKVGNNVIDGNFSSAFNSAKEGVTKLFADEDDDEEE